MKIQIEITNDMVKNKLKEYKTHNWFYGDKVDKNGYTKHELVEFDEGVGSSCKKKDYFGDRLIDWCSYQLQDNNYDFIDIMIKGLIEENILFLNWDYKLLMEEEVE